MRLLGLDEIAGQPVGGKAHGLARLRAMGLRVPEAIVLVGAKPGLWPEDLDARVASLGDVPLAVRSSAIGEDGQDASFAGQYETVLGVRGADALREAIDACLRSAENARSAAYREERDASETSNEPDQLELAGVEGAAVMSVVIQRMVDARASGVTFTADPVTNRRGRLVIDSVAGLGEALVSGHASPDHDELIRAPKRWAPQQLAGAAPVLSEKERDQIAAEALEAESLAEEPLDLEWAIDQSGELFWLQARPITTLGADPQDLDTRTRDARDVFTRCNVGEMMPGAVSPLTFSTCARGIDVGWQLNMKAVGLRDEIDPENAYIGMSHGHLFINLSEGARFSTAVTGSHPDQQSLAICGRIVPEVVAPPVPPLRTRWPRMAKQVAAVLRPGPRIARMEALVAEGEIEPGSNALESWRRIDARMQALFEAYALHLTVSSGAGALAPILLRVLAGEGEPTDEHHAVVAHLFSGAEDVESADIAEGATRLLAAVERESSRPADFETMDVAEALAWLESKEAGKAGRVFREYRKRHGHRSLRELDVRQPEWAHDPSPIIRSLQAGLRGRLRSAAANEGGTAAALDRSGDRSENAPPPGAERFRFLTRVAHAAVRNRETGKSLLVALTAIFKRAYRNLATQLVSEGRLPDVDAVYFLLHEELADLAAESDPSSARVATLSQWATQRREALAYQETLSFPEVAVGLPEPEAPAEPEFDSANGDLIVGKPVSRGVATGQARVVATLEEAEALEPGEILIAPITDVGWTPYFSIIAGLATDVGSAVSHGAVVAREYGLPAVLNTGGATRRVRTGDRVRLDGDRGHLEILERAAPISEPEAQAEAAQSDPLPMEAREADPASTFVKAIAAIDAANAEDPNSLLFRGESRPQVLLQAERATHWIHEMEPAPSETLLLAARAHHLRRWELPRSDFEQGRAGYHAWRRAQARRHADGAGDLLERLGYEEESVRRVGEIIRKEGLGEDPEVQTLEDALCLVFLETQLEDFAAQHPEEKVVDVIARSLAKMSPRGRSVGAKLELPGDGPRLLSRAMQRFEERA